MCQKKRRRKSLDDTEKVSISVIRKRERRMTTRKPQGSEWGMNVGRKNRHQRKEGCLDERKYASWTRLFFFF